MNICKFVRLVFNFCKSCILYLHYSCKYRKVDFFCYKELADPRFCSPNHFAGSTAYGNYKAIKHSEHKRINFLRDYIEHGVSFYSDPENVRLLGPFDRRGVRNIYTFSEKRANLINEYLKAHHLYRNVIPVGPYILKASNHLTHTKLDTIQKKYGKILLVFPSHSSVDYEANFSIDLLLHKIDKVKKDFDSVFVCLYWMNILKQPQLIKQYEAEGYIVVSAGHGCDPHFLSRLKDIISLSDMVLTNGLGTHIGYSICMNKPVYYINDISTKTKIADIELVKNKCNLLFGEYSHKITPEQIDFVESYWGKWDR